MVTGEELVVAGVIYHKSRNRQTAKATELMRSDNAEILASKVDRQVPIIGKRSSKRDNKDRTIWGLLHLI